MIKKILGLLIALVLLFSLMACDSFNLDEYKETAKGIIDDYAATKVETDYPEENWTALCDAVTAGKAAVDEATTRAQVDTAVEDTIQAVDGIQEGERVGVFYTLQEAYDERMLTRDNIKHIVYFMDDEVYEIIDGNNEWIKIEFEPQIEKPVISALKQNIINAMKKAFYEMNRDDNFRDINENDAIESISIVSFLGKYNGSYAMRLKSNFWVTGAAAYPVNVANIVWEQSYPPIIVFTYDC